MFIPASQLKMHSSPEDIGPVDWVLVALKSTSLSEAASLIKPLLKQNLSTRVFAIMNGLVDEDLVSSLANLDGVDNHNTDLPCATVYGGMAFICSNRVNPGQIDHSYAGRLSGGVSMSSESLQEDLDALHKLWEPTKVEFIAEPSLVQARWIKNVWNLPFNGISVAMGGITVDKICNDPGLRKLADTIMDETIAIACADIDSKGGNAKEYDWEKLVRNQNQFDDVLKTANNHTYKSNMLMIQPMISCFHSKSNKIKIES